MKQYMNIPTKNLIIVLTILMSALAHAVEYQKTSFTKFFDNQIAPIPLSIEIPKNYVHAKKIEAGITQVFWMQPNEVDKVIKTDILPKKTGSIRGQISMSEAYSKDKGKFSSEESLKADLKKVNMTLIETKRFVINGYPVFAYLVKAKNGTIVGAINVATMIDTNVLFFGYTPPNNDLELGKEVWNHMVSSIKKSALPQPNEEPIKQ
jgi:hypothetical protein